MYMHRMSTRSSLRFLSAAALLFLPSTGSRAQAPAPEQTAPASAAPAEQQPVAIIKKESRLVLVDAVVTDKKGTYIHDVAQTD